MTADEAEFVETEVMAAILFQTPEKILSYLLVAYLKVLFEFFI